MTPRQMRTLIEAALREKAPLLLAGLERAGGLNDFLRARTEAALEEIEDAEAMRMTEVYRSDLPYLERVRRLTAIRKAAEEEAIAHAVDLGG